MRQLNVLRETIVIDVDKLLEKHKIISTKIEDLTKYLIHCFTSQ